MFRDMKTSKHLKPGQDGTKRLVEKYGDALLCVRYRDDEQRGVRIKTVELIEEEKPYRSGRRYQDGDMVMLAMHYSEKACGTGSRQSVGNGIRIKNSGGFTMVPSVAMRNCKNGLCRNSRQRLTE